MIAEERFEAFESELLELIEKHVSAGLDKRDVIAALEMTAQQFRE